MSATLGTSGVVTNAGRGRLAEENDVIGFEAGWAWKQHQVGHF